MTISRPKKSLGQHFLSRHAIIHRVLRALDLTVADRVLEIGPGKGALTHPLAERAAKLLLVEKDRFLAEELAAKFQEKPQVEVLEADFLALDWGELERRLGSGFKVVSNLPYNVGTAILTKLLLHAAPFSVFVLMFQKEVGERLLAGPGTKAYGSLSIFAQILSEPRFVCAVPPQAFRPPPRVESSVLKFQIRERPLVPAKNREAFEKFVQVGFAQRRKMLRHNLRTVFSGEDGAALEARLTEVAAKPTARAEELTVEQWIKLFENAGPGLGIPSKQALKVPSTIPGG